MKNLETFPEDIFNLLGSKKFVELTDEEKYLIKPYMTVGEYHDYHEMISDVRVLDQTIPSTIPDIRLINKRASMIKKIVDYKMPLYQVAAAIAFCIFSTATLTQHFSQSPNSNMTQIDDSSKKGVSLAEDNFPEQLVFNF